ncbi:type III-B CRISPR module-associated Cmr3 family protein [Allorhodopirellula heiligendammensis]|uniref:CRISPR-associated protein n=1 Tax=Allorhodopirellula heiligendammensis TaxID=2714739 RepID=A0A5C6C090_9BACT|nr:type III-B CRISPR module-associated Cmr3 family protein [Allorhodopirellula heiligendammensis]TWU17953.1 CRISPR-associated protein [Allorhodopirellula heiligendammensis]
MSETRWYKITPGDSWFFCDSRSANAGEDQSDLQSIFPPYPQTVVGAIRAALARSLGWERGNWDEAMKAKLGDGFDDVSPLRFTSPMLAIKCEKSFPQRELQLLFQPPMHLIGTRHIESGDSGSPLPTFDPLDWLRPSSDPFMTDMGSIHLPLFPVSGDADNRRLRTADDFFITTSGMQSVLDGNKPDKTELIHQSRLFAMENRIGINREADARSIYSPGHVRLFDGVSLVIGVDGLSDDIELPLTFPLGGESRQAVCERLRQAPVRPQSRSGTCVVLTTAARWLNRWYGVHSGGSATGLHPSFGSKVTTCAVGRPTRIGGFDSRTGRSQTLQAYAPAGSVWWLDESVSLPEDTWCLSLGERTSLGYGTALLAREPVK